MFGNLAKLVEFKTDAEAHFVMRNLPSYVSTAHIIYTERQRNDANEWVFISNDEAVDMSARTWGINEPHGGLQTCGSTRGPQNFPMLDCYCTGTHNYICENIVSTSTTPTTTAVSGCKDGWIVSPDDKCYYVSSTLQITYWTVAVNQCLDIGAKLVEFKTDAEAHFVMRNLPSYVSTPDILYTGRKRNDANEWVFISNDEAVNMSVRTWGSGEPHGGQQACGCTKASQNFLMLDCYCTATLYYICENIGKCVIFTALPSLKDAPLPTEH
ncbi:macrophage mannose receptor 1-like isoform X2 [Argopecten irradians]|uniref:macrophage mannose receptor 1-like isoform X2 n=1 Tax=Argopecten irradians TaxID=31199 RepID=UPI0037205325